MRNFIFILYLIFDIVLGFNIDTKNPIVYVDQTKYLEVNASEKSSYFGLSVILYAGDINKNSWIQIGAPRGNSPYITEAKNPGIIFRCPIGDRCDYLNVDNETGPIYNEQGYYVNKFDDAWLGAVMDINLSSNRSVVCAPRWIDFFRPNRRGEDYFMLGACYWSNRDSKKFHKKIPLLNDYNAYFTDIYTNTSVYNYGLGQSGFAVNMPKDEKQLLIGAPGVLNWKGSAILYNDASYNDNAPSAALRQERDLSDIEIFHDVNIANLSSITETLAYGYFGYAVTSGYFYSKMSLYYASGAPRSKNLFGQVLIYDFQTDNYKTLNVKDSKQGTQFGEYFGASLAAGDINNDGLDDLFVGAPFHKNSKYNEGRMYLFLGSKKGNLREPLKGKFIDGGKINGLFGTTIMYLGDMNYDRSAVRKPKYVAVSAPYEDSGVVYIYKGNVLGLDVVPVQRIAGDIVSPNLKGFGISISPPADIDRNGYKDIAIGAYESGHVVLLRSRPLVSVTTYFQNAPTFIMNKMDRFFITACHKYYSFKGKPSIQLRRRIVVDEDFGRAFLTSETQYIQEVTIYESRPTCENITIHLRNSSTNTYDPLSVKIIHNLIEDEDRAGSVIITDKLEGEDLFCRDCGVYDKTTSTQIVTKTFPYLLGCGDDNICDSMLEFECRFSGTGVRNNTFILGAANVVEMETIVENFGEKAYLLRVQVDIPNGLNFKQTPTLCIQNLTSIICPVVNPLDKNEKRSLSLKLDMDYVNRRIVENFLLITVTVLTSSHNINAATKVVKLGLESEVDISISGKSGEQSYAYGNNSNRNVEIQQIYQIAKYGLSPVSSIRLQILIPYAMKTDNTTFISLYQPEGYLDGGQSLIFKSTIPYLKENKLGASEGIDPGKTIEIRNRRAVDFEKDYNSLLVKSSNISHESLDSDLLGNGTLEINCNMTEIVCGKVTGIIGPFDGSKKSAVLQLKMLLDTKALSAMLHEDAIIRFSTYGFVNIEDPPNLSQSGTRPDMVTVSSLFVNDAKKKNIDIWIIIVSIALGFLLLLILTAVLTKAGFFKRTKKEELESLKAQISNENTGGAQ